MPIYAKHDPSDLNDALEHVVYEMWKYRQSVADYQKIGGDAAIEFRVLHHRVLLEFFYGPAKHRDNIVAWEYIDDWQSGHDGASLPWLDGYMTRCHTMLAHISTTRTEMKKRGLKDWRNEWKVVEPHLDQIISDFLGRLSNDHKKICLRWLNEWMNGDYPAKHALKGLAAATKLS